MAKNFKRVALMLVVLALCVGAVSMVAFASYEVRAEIPVRITLGGTPPQTDETFVVEVTAADAAYPMPEGAENGVYRMAMEGASTETIVIDFNRLGVYEYEVRQITGTNGDCYYDDSVYHVTAYVTNSESGDGYSLTVVVYRDSETDKLNEISFQNVYANPDQVVITAVKTLDGKTPKDGRFTFELLDSNGKLVKTTKNVGKDVTFEALRYNEAGTYKYQLKEVQGDEKSIIYDKSVYDVIVEVIKDENGNYDAKLSYEKNGKAYSGSPIFANETKTDIPTTGDEFNMQLMVSLMILSVVGIVTLVVLRRRTKMAD